MKLYGITKKNQMLYHIICDLIPFNVIVWYNSYFHMLYHIIHNVIPLFLTVYRRALIRRAIVCANVVCEFKSCMGAHDSVR